MMRNENSVYKILKENPEILGLAKFLLQKGVGIILPTKMKIELERLLAIELDEGLRFNNPGDWAYEIGQMVIKKDIKQMRKTAQDFFNQDPSCPACNWHARIRIRADKSYICDHCKETWKF